MPFFRTVGLHESAGLHVCTRQVIPRTPSDPRPYLTRWRLFSCRWFGILLHRFSSPDHDRATHNHPWAFLSIVLRGGYIEERLHNARAGAFRAGCELITQERRGVGSIALRRASSFHRVLELLRVPTWTLVVTGPRRGVWGFLELGRYGWIYRESSEHFRMVENRERLRRQLRDPESHLLTSSELRELREIRLAHRRDGH